jgi:hypothetical protein
VEGRGKGYQRNGRAGRIVGRVVDPKNIQALYPEQAGRIADTFGDSQRKGQGREKLNLGLMKN